MKKQLLLLTLSFLLAGTAAHAKIRVVTTLPSFADIAGEVGGDAVDATSLTKGTQDPHFVDAKPSLVLNLNKANLLVRAGLGLEDGWLPPLLTASRNGDIQSGGTGDLIVANLIHLKEVPQGVIDRTQGDVHPGGNPHFMLDPRNGIVLAKALAERLGRLDPSKAEEFKKRADDYAKRLQARIAGWDKQLAPLKGKKVVTYHKSWIYFLDWAGLVEGGNIEPKPGIPPSPDHIAKLINQMKDEKVKLILMEPYYPGSVGEEVAARTGAKLLVLPTEVYGNKDARNYEAVFDEIIKALLQNSGT